jgi:hypothetical protein
VFHLAGRHQSELVALNLATGHEQVLRRQRFAQLLNPSLLGDRLLYVRVDECRQQLLLGSAGPGSGAHDRVLASRPTEVPRDSGYERGVIREGRSPHHCTQPRSRPGERVASFWTTALSPTFAFLTVLRTGAGHSMAQVRKVRRG